ncbi:MAG: TIGR02186 family protein [Acidihalobacter sp.]|jgi:uncharacterized protein (TIGR02186 family)
MKKLLLSLVFLIPVLAWAQSGDLVTELTRDHVDISARYTGDEIMLFGAMSAPGQIVVKVRSPAQPVALEKKGRVGPFWLSQGKHEIKRTPGLYYLLSSAPIDGMLPVSVRAAHGLDLSDALKNMQVSPAAGDATAQQTLKDAVLRLKQARGYYVADPKAVEVLGGRLYSTTIRLPAQLPLGEYEVDIYLVRNGQVVATQHRRISVDEVQMEHWISGVAGQHSWTFGVLFTLSMMLLGLLLGVVLGRSKKN